jgi:hypothetical protein
MADEKTNKRIYLTADKQPEENLTALEKVIEVLNSQADRYYRMIKERQSIDGRGYANVRNRHKRD